MKLDKYLMRDILLAVEAHPEPSANYVPLDLPEHDAEVVSYHVMLLAEGGFLKALALPDESQLVWYPQRLTYSGTELVAKIRDGEAWGKTKVVASRMGGESVAFVLELAKAQVKSKFGLP